MKTIVIDSESDNFKFESTIIWMIQGYCLEDKQWYVSYDSSIMAEGVWYTPNNVQVLSHESMLGFITDYKVVGHNIFQHDYPLFQKFYPDWELDWRSQVEDTMVMSGLFYPDRLGGHSLGSWGLRLGEHKGDFHEFDRFSKEMVDYGLQDVIVGVKTYRALLKEMEGWDWSESLTLEYAMAYYQGRQEMYGVAFDKDSAIGLKEDIESKLSVIDSKLSKGLPPKVIQGTEYLEPFKRDGTLKSNVVKWFEEEC